MVLFLLNLLLLIVKLFSYESEDYLDTLETFVVEKL